MYVCISLAEGESWTAGSHFLDEFLGPMWKVTAGETFSLAVCCCCFHLSSPNSIIVKGNFKCLHAQGVDSQCLELSS